MSATVQRLPTMFEQLSSMARKQALVARFNPRPAGRIIPGSTTDLVLQCLREHGGFMTHAQIILKVERDRGAVAWALLFLKQQGMIRSVSDGSRNPRYCRYRATEDKESPR